MALPCPHASQVESSAQTGHGSDSAVRLTPQLLQVVYWGVLEQKYASEVSQQHDVFSTEQSSQRQKDFRSALLLSQPFWIVSCWGELLS